MSSALGRAFAVAAIFALGACAATKPLPTAQSIAGLPPSGTVTLHQTTVAGLTEGSGTLTFQGTTTPFKVVGTVLGPGGASEITASGEVYKLASVSDFGGRYTEGTGAAGIETSGREDLWLQNNAGVIMHLRGNASGVTLSLGREEILVRLAQ